MAPDLLPDIGLLAIARYVLLSVVRRLIRFLLGCTPRQAVALPLQTADVGVAARLSRARTYRSESGY
jgi:hypothetical protein